MLYIAQGFSLALLNSLLFNDSIIKAEKIGPIIPSVYNKFKDIKDQKIRKSVRLLDVFPVCFNFGMSNNDEYKVPKVINKKKKKMIKLTWVTYGNELITDLDNLTQKPGTPWSVTRESHNKIIQNDLMKLYYRRFVKNLKRNLNYETT